MKPLRTIILDAVDSMLLNSTDKKNVIASINDVYRQLLEVQNAFLIERIVYGHFIHLLTDSEVQSSIKWLQSIKEQLSGQQLHIHTYVLRYPFVQLLEGETLEVYQGLLKLYNIVVQKVNNLKLDEIPEDYEEFRENVFLLYGGIKAKSVADLLVIQACHTLFSIPDDQRSFDVTEVFGSIYPTPTITTIDTHFSYIQGILNKLLGNEVLYVEVCILPDANYMINLR